MSNVGPTYQPLQGYCFWHACLTIRILKDYLHRIVLISSSILCISVTDTGCGIPAEHLPRIFERFYLVNKDRSREVGGTGLGLAIVKRIVEAHGSKVEVKSEVGKGSVFSFVLKK